VLILGRKVGQRIVLGNGVVFTVTAIRGTQVRLGVEAPEDVPVWREEVAPDGRGAAPGRESAARRARAR
jgi:carbon storage regulator